MDWWSSNYFYLLTVVVLCHFVSFIINFHVGFLTLIVCAVILCHITSKLTAVCCWRQLDGRRELRGKNDTAPGIVDVGPALFSQPKVTLLLVVCHTSCGNFWLTYYCRWLSILAMFHPESSNNETPWKYIEIVLMYVWLSHVFSRLLRML